MPLTPQGLDAPRAADLLVQIRAELDTRLGVVVDYERDLLLDSLTAIMAIVVGDISEALQAVYDARDPSNATGDQLSSLALAIGVVREAATPSTVTVQIIGAEGTAVLIGRTIRHLPGRELFDIVEDVVIPVGLSVDARAEARVSGAVPVPADISGDDWEIVTPVVGWNNVTNTAAGTTGEARETDDELRIRRQNSLQIGGSTSAAAMQAAILQIPNVAAAVVLENDDALPIVIDGVSLDPHSAGVIVHPPTLDTDDQALVARAIYDNLAAGIKTNGSVVAVVQGADLQDKTIRFDFSVAFLVGVLISVVMESPSISDPNPPTFAEVEPQIQTALAAHALTFGLGEDVLKLPILTLLDAVGGIRSATVLLVPADPLRLDAAGDVTIFSTERATLTIPVTVVDVTP